MDGLTTGQLAERAGVNVQTVRYYERRGLLAEPERTAARYRVYPESDIGRLRFIRRAQALGFTLSEIEELLSLRVSERTGPDDLRERVRQKVSGIDERIRDLQEIRDALARMAGACTVHVLSTRCPFLQTLEAQEDAASRRPEPAPNRPASTREEPMHIRGGAVRMAIVAAILAVGVMLSPSPAWAHCDGMDGPVVKAAQKALETKNLNHVLLWVRPQDEPEIRHAFEHTLQVRQLNTEARRLADRFFFETVVRIHRAGEGAAYTGLKPAGRDLGAAIPAADRSIESGSLEEVERILLHAVRDGLRERYQKVMQAREFDPDDVAAGRAFVAAYVPYLHFVEVIHAAAHTEAHAHHPPHGTQAGGAAHHGH
jgi:DNA-binding transcriptional MerR regulator